jgi:tripartite-type tricarboxylate transporter receptor subunit TctC
VAKQLSYDPVKDLAPVMLLSRSPNVIAVNPAVKATSMKDFIELARANPGKLHYGSPGVGSAPHLVGESLRQRFGIDLVHVPYKGGGSAVVDVISGQIELLITGGATVARYTDGSLRFLAYTSDKRSVLLPDVPTMAEAGIPGFVLGTCCAVFAPGGTPQPVLERLAKELAPIARDADFRSRLAKIGHDLLDPLTGPAVTKFMVAEAENWRGIAQRAGVA